MSGQVFFGDCREHLKSIPDDSIDSVCTDPPSGIAFMGENWDHFKPSEEEEEVEGRAELLAFQNFLVEVFKEVYRVMKPGAHGLVWSLPRTSHHTAMALERCGFEIRDKISHLQSQGYRKGQDVGKAIDKAKGIKRTKVIGVKPGHEEFAGRKTKGHLTGFSSENSGLGGFDRPWMHDEEAQERYHLQFAPESTEAERWEGWHTGLKPAVEEWILIRKPLSGKTIVENLLKYGVGALNIDASRVYTDWNEPDRPDSWKRSGHTAKPEAEKIAAPPGQGIVCHPKGRWPANVILSHSASCVRVGTKVIKAHPQGPDRFQKTKGGNFSKEYGNQDTHEEDEVLPKYKCAPDCPVRALDEQSGIHTNTRHMSYKRSGVSYVNSIKDKPEWDWWESETGGASRFFKTFTPEYDVSFYYSPKVSGSERKKDLEEEEFINDHPTVKGRKLMRYLVRLVTPPGGVVLDPFAGSGTTLVACIDEGFDYIGMERKPEYFKILEARVGAASRVAEEKQEQRDVFDLAMNLESE